MMPVSPALAAPANSRMSPAVRAAFFIVIPFVFGLVFGGRPSHAHANSLAATASLSIGQFRPGNPENLRSCRRSSGQPTLFCGSDGFDVWTACTEASYRSLTDSRACQDIGITRFLMALVC